MTKEPLSSPAAAPASPDEKQPEKGPDLAGRAKNIGRAVAKFFKDERQRLFIDVVVGLIVATIVSIPGILHSPIAYRLKIVRSFVKPMEKYSGKYVQIFKHTERKTQDQPILSAAKSHKQTSQTEVKFRYSIVDIKYNNDSDKYTLSGRQFDDNGRPLTTFTSDLVDLKVDVQTFFEFIWKTVDVSDTLPENEERKVEGYTRMMFVDLASIDKSGGVGFFYRISCKRRKGKTSFF